MTALTVIEEWDRWFEATGDEEAIRAWRVAKEMHPNQVVGWATIIELSRIDRMTKRTIPTRVNGVR